MDLALTDIPRLSSVIFFVFFSCTDAVLEVAEPRIERLQDNRMGVSGQFCAEDAESLDAFLKVMFVLDQSNSMNVTDPTGRRITAAAELVERYIQNSVDKRLRPGVEIAVVGFFGDVVTYTKNERGLPGYTKEGDEALFALTRTAQTSSNTGYDKALAQAFTLLDTDIARLSARSQARSRYEIIFVSDGMPFPDNCRGEANSPSAAINATKRIAGLKSVYDAQLTLHTVFASAPGMFSPGNDIDPCEENAQASDEFEANFNNSLGQETRALLQAMALEGGGSFTQFENGGAISLLGFDFAETRRLYALSNLSVANHSARFENGTVLADSDFDGLTDLEESQIGTSSLAQDTDGDGVRDAIEWRFRRSGSDPLDPTDGRCPDAERGDLDFDGLRDCEETLLGTSRRRFDTDADGMSDSFEFYARTSPVSSGPLADLESDSDGDGARDFQEAKWHLNPLVDDIAEGVDAAYQYLQSELPLTSGDVCYDFEVNNITLASTESVNLGENRILLEFAQTPYDDPLSEAIYRVACVDARFVAELDLKSPAGGRVDIPGRRPGNTFAVEGALDPKSAQCAVSVDVDCGPNTLRCRMDEVGGCRCTDFDGNDAGPCPECSDGLDNDGDGRSDFPSDPSCFGSIDNTEGAGPACSDGDDNDGDGRSDWPNDPGCSDVFDDDENDGPSTECSDGIDNDGDGVADYPDDPHCYAAADTTEALSLATAYPCDDGLDNDGDGLIDSAANSANPDPGCADPNDIDESGPDICFYCQTAAELLPGQCELSSGFCRARSGAPPAGTCSTREDCRGAPCVDGVCQRCVEDSNCDSALDLGDGLCDESVGWCLERSFEPIPCGVDADCPGACDADTQHCEVDPQKACTKEEDCGEQEICLTDYGLCLASSYTMRRCDALGDCEVGTCVDGWCLPQTPETQCLNDALCPGGLCTEAGHCETSSFVFPRDFDAAVDCWSQN